MRSIGGFVMWLHTRMNFTDVYTATKLIFSSKTNEIYT